MTPGGANCTSASSDLELLQCDCDSVTIHADTCHGHRGCPVINAFMMMIAFIAILKLMNSIDECFIVDVILITFVG